MTLKLWVITGVRLVQKSETCRQQYGVFWISHLHKQVIILLKNSFTLKGTLDSWTSRQCNTCSFHQIARLEQSSLARIRLLSPTKWPENEGMSTKTGPCLERPLCADKRTPSHCCDWQWGFAATCIESNLPQLLSHQTALLFLQGTYQLE